VAQFLVQHGVDALPYHAGMEPARRAAHQARFQRDEACVIVATIAFGMGIDKPDVRFVAHLDMPKSVEGYFQETGRAGRDGMPADAWMAYGLADVVQQRRLIEQSEADENYNGCRAPSSTRCWPWPRRPTVAVCACSRTSARPAAPAATATTAWHRRRCATRPRTRANCCRRSSAASRRRLRLAATHVIDVLRGKVTDKVTRFGHQRLSTFGIGADRSEAEWRLLLRQLVAQHLVDVDVDHFKRAAAHRGEPIVLRGERRVELRVQLHEPRRRAKAGRAVAVEGLDATSEGLFVRLREWRAGVAKEHGVPAYVVFQDGTLRAIASQRPQSPTELARISGVGVTKLERYGPAVLELIGGAGA